MGVGRRKCFGYVLLLMVAAALLWIFTFGLYSLPYVQSKHESLKASCPTYAFPTPPQCPSTFGGVHPLSSEPPYGCRLQEIRRRCEERNIKPGSFNTKRFKYNDKIPLIMCELPKVASSTWQKVLMQLNGFDGNFTKELMHRIAYGGFPLKTLGNVTEEQAKEMVKVQTTFMVTRHPLERLVSAYFEKFSNRSTLNYYQREVGIPIAKKQAPDFLHGIGVPLATGGLEALLNSSQFTQLEQKKKNDVIAYRRTLQTGEISFQQFIRHVLSFQRGKTAHQMDVHWRPQVLLCQPCSFTYSMVMRFENLVDESNRLLEFVQRGRNTNITFPGESKPFTQSKTTVDALQLISEADVNRLRDLYADDFFVLGHDPYRYSGQK